MSFTQVRGKAPPTGLASPGLQQWQQWAEYQHPPDLLDQLKKKSRSVHTAARDSTGSSLLITMANICTPKLTNKITTVKDSSVLTRFLSFQNPPCNVTPTYLWRAVKGIMFLGVEDATGSASRKCLSQGGLLPLQCQPNSSQTTHSVFAWQMGAPVGTPELALPAIAPCQCVFI